MSELNFRIILVPKRVINSQRKDQLLLLVKSAIEKCGLTSVSVNYPRVKKDENNDNPQVEALTFDIRGNMELLPHTSKVQLYEEFRIKCWSHFYALPTSYIEFYSSDSFVKCKRSHHEVTYKNFTFGVLPHNYKFYRFSAYFENKQRQLVHFYHDTRNVVIDYLDFEITFSYQNIKSIFITLETTPSKLYFDLFNPPIIFQIKPTASPDNEIRCRNFLPVDPDVLGRANVLCLTFPDSENIPEVIARIHNQCSEKSVYYSIIVDERKDKPLDPDIDIANFDCTYLITALFKRNFTLNSQTSDISNSLKRLKDLSLQNPDLLEKALISVLFALDSGKILNFWNAIETQYIYYESNDDELNFKDYIVPSKCTMIRRIILTPTRQLLWPKEIMMSNRILRNFDPEYSLRVSFREENLSRLSLNAVHADKIIMKSCIKSPMINGIHIGPRKYEFLAWSNSQIRDHGVWMYAKDEKGHTADKIREWMGDFSHIHKIPKYMARMGLCFSQTEDTLSVPLNPKLVRMEDDIEKGYDKVNKKPYCFSDGIGKISAELASQVHEALDHDKLCSAFQIRYGGCKGMLVIDPTLKDAQIVLRKSMMKFNCPNSTRLEISRTSAPVPLYLNRPFITLLNALGVRHRTFLRLQENMLKTLTEMLYEESAAAEFLQSHTSTVLYNYKDLSNAGIYLTTEPFFKSLLLALHRHRIEKLKSRANIAIDPSKGRNMLGVLDETRSLNYGEVFVQYSKEILAGGTSRDTSIHEGVVLVTKSPCMYPSDVRKFRAVDKPSLHHIVDCIVFPQKGPRPHPNEMAGSDLDGDEYAVLWDPDLIFYGDNYTAPEFPVKECRDARSIDICDMICFLQDYIKSDQVGATANAHLAHADKDGIFSPLCLRIAKKFFVAVDFAKNGKLEKLGKTQRPKEYPDFMENAYKKMYKSKNALGKMYRVCKDFESENQVASINYENIKVDPDLVYTGWEKYQNNALAARNKYDALFRSVLSDYGIQHEGEAISGAFTHLHTRFHERRDRNDIEKVIVSCIKKLNKCMFEEFIEEFSSSSSVDVIEDEMLKKASAWYIVTYSDPNAKFLSFPWSVSNCLVNIKLRRTLANIPSFSPAIMNLDQKILECDSVNSLTNTAFNLLSTYKQSYLILCHPLILNRALCTLILWAQQEGIVDRPGYSNGLLHMSVFANLFFHVSEILGYVTRQPISLNTIDKPYSAGQLCLDFLKYCSTFRFYNKYEMKEILPFSIHKHSHLAKCAIVSYHKFALSGTLHTLNFDEELITMKNPIFIESNIFPVSPISATYLKSAEVSLMVYSKVNELSLREILQTKKVCVTANGSEEALKKLKYILRKKRALQSLISYGIVPQ